MSDRPVVKEAAATPRVEDLLQSADQWIAGADRWMEQHTALPGPVYALVRDLRLVLDQLATAQAQIAALTAERDKVRGCPHGENCACAIGSRHEWFVSFCRDRDERYSEQDRRTAAQEAITQHWQPKLEAAEAQLQRCRDILRAVYYDRWRASGDDHDAALAAAEKSVAVALAERTP
jgi:hypothetical protein